jgi:hypothetical protein
MSKLSDRIRRAARPDPAPIGFGTMSRTQTPSMLTVVRLGGDVAKASDAAQAGADAVIAEGDPAKLKDAPAIVGVKPGKADAAAAAALRDGGADFLVLEPASALAESMLDDKLGFVLELRDEIDDTHLRLIGELSLDAIIVPAPAPPVTLARLLEYRRIGALARAPLLAEVGPDIDAALLHVLRESGTAGVIVDASGLGGLGGLRERIASLPPRGARKRDSEDRAQPIVPAATASDDDDDDDYDDD